MLESDVLKFVVTNVAFHHLYAVLYLLMIKLNINQITLLIWVRYVLQVWLMGVFCILAQQACPFHWLNGDVESPSKTKGKLVIKVCVYYYPDIVVCTIFCFKIVPLFSSLIVKELMPKKSQPFHLLHHLLKLQGNLTLDRNES